MKTVHESNDSHNAHSTPVKRVDTSTTLVCSESASNDPTFRVKRKHQQFEESSYANESDEEDYEGLVERVPIRRNAYAKRRRRRYKISKKMGALRKLIPNCNKVDEASMLDDAIEYLKALQLQAKIMSMGCTSQMMLHARMQQMYAPCSSCFSPLITGMSTRMATSTSYNQAHFPISLSMIPTTRFPMVGIPGQVLPTSLSSAYLVHFPGVYSAAHSVRMGNVFGATSTVEHPW